MLIPSFMTATREKLATFLNLMPWNRMNLSAPAAPTVSTAVLAPPCRIQGDSPAACLAAYHEAMKRGPAGGVAFTILWRRLMPLADEAVIAKAQARVLKYGRDFQRVRGEKHIFAISSLERDGRLGLHGHYFMQASLEAQDALMDGVERILRADYGGELPPLAYRRGSRTFPYNQAEGRISSAAMGVGWVKYLLKGAVQADNDLGITRKPGMLEVQVVAIKWGSGRVPDMPCLNGALAVRPEAVQDQLH